MADAAGVGLERFEGDSAIAVEKYTFEKNHRLAESALGLELVGI